MRKKAGADGLAAINTIKSIMNVDLNGFSTSPNVSGKSSANVPTTFSEMNQMYSACLLMPTNDDCVAKIRSRIYVSDERAKDMKKRTKFALYR